MTADQAGNERREAEWPDPPYYAEEMAALLRQAAATAPFRVQGGPDYCNGLRRAADLVIEFGVRAPVPSPATPTRQFRSERLRAVIRDALDGLFNDEDPTEVVAAAAEAWFLSTSLRTQPDFVAALIAADEFDWENAQPVDLKAYLAEMTDRRAASPVAVPLPEETEDGR